MAGKREVKVVISGDSSGAQRALHQVDTSGTATAAHAEGVSAKIGGSFGKLGHLIGGEFGEVLSRISEGFEATGEHGMNMGKKFAAAGGIVTAAGAALTLGGSKEKQAQDQLSAAIDATGNAASDYKDKIEEAVKSGEKYAHGAADTKGALAALTLATQDPTKALEDMTVVENLAAQKHESLTEAAGQVAKVYGGAGKILKQYGITLDSTKSATAHLASAETQHQAAVDRLAKAQRSLADIEAVDATHKKLTIGQEIQLRNAREAVANASDNLKAKTQNLTVAQDRAKDSTHFADDALGQLNTRLNGQASASVDNWGGKVAVLRTKLSDWTAEMGQKFGPAITATGPILIAAGMAMDLYSGHVDKVALRQAALALKAEESAAQVAASDAEMVVAAETTEAGIGAALGPIGIVGAIAGVVGAAAIATHGFGLFGGGARAQVKPVDDLTQAILSDKDAVGQLTQANLNQKLSASGAYDAGLKLGISQDIVLKATMGNVDAQKTIKAAVDNATAAYDKATQHVATFGSSSKAGSSAVKQATQAQIDAKSAADKLAGSTGLLTAQVNASKHAADNQVIAIRGTKVATTATESAVLNLSAALHQVPRDVRSQVSQTGAAEVKKAIALIPKSWISRGLVTADVSGALAALSYLKETAQQVASAMPVGSMTQSPQHAARAAGGTAGGRTLVGEQGFEFVDLPPNSHVYTHAQSMAMASAGPPASSATAEQPPIVVEAHFYLDGQELHGGLLRYKRQTGKASLGL
jgi:hypothetical protein